MFVHTVHGPLKLLCEKWLCEGTEQNLLDYVSKFRLRLRRVCEIAAGNLEAAQARMKGLFEGGLKAGSSNLGTKSWCCCRSLGRVCRLAIVSLIWFRRRSVIGTCSHP